MKWVEENEVIHFSSRAAQLMGGDQVHDEALRQLKAQSYLRCEALAMMIQRMEEGY